MADKKENTLPATPSLGDDDYVRVIYQGQSTLIKKSDLGFCSTQDLDLINQSLQDDYNSKFAQLGISPYMGLY